MPIMEDTIKELMAEENAAEETVETKAQVEDKPAEEPKPAEEQKPDDTTVEEPKPAEEVEAPSDDDRKPPKDTSQFTKEEKAEHAFKRQLARQREKHAEEMQNLIKSFDQKLEDFKQSFKPAEKKAQPKREDFEYDDDFVNALVKYNMEQEQAARAAKDAEAAKEREAREAEERAAQEQQQAVAEAFNANCRETIPAEEYEDFTAKVRLASSHGLADLLDKAPVVRDYIFSTRRGPRLLHAMLKERDTFANVMRTAATATNPMSAMIELDDIARGFDSKPAQAVQEPAQEQQQVRTMPKLGKPGSGGTKESAMDITSDDEALIKFMRKRM